MNTILIFNVLFLLNNGILFLNAMYWFQKDKHLNRRNLISVVLWYGYIRNWDDLLPGLSERLRAVVVLGPPHAQVVVRSVIEWPTQSFHLVVKQGIVANRIYSVISVESWEYVFSLAKIDRVQTGTLLEHYLCADLVKF